MNRIAISQFRRAGVAAPPEARPWTRRWFGRLVLLLLGVGLLTASFAPANQFYLAWAGLVPWLLVVQGTRSYKSAFFWGWVGGTLFFIANMWWIALVTSWGMVGLMALLGLYWGLTAVILRAARLLGPNDAVAGADEVDERSTYWPGWMRSPLLRILLIAAVWVSVAEWLRGSWPWHGLPWLYLGHTQSPVLWLCQIADLTGVPGISFIMVAANAWIALWVLNRLSPRGLQSAGVVVLLLISASAGYGAWRMHSERLLSGPQIAVVQPNYPQDPSGQKGAKAEEMLNFHFQTSQQTLATHPQLDLLVWSETMLPPLNQAAREALAETNLSQLISVTLETLAELAARGNVGILSGGEYVAGYTPDGNYFRPQGMRNVAYFVNRDGTLSHERYDKIHLVPFGEFTPFRYGFPALYRLIVRLGPPDMKYFNLDAGDESALTVFHLPQRNGGPAWRLVTPICFEDLDATLCAKMFRPDPAYPDQKRADVLLNLTNDGWFLANENAQHLQSALFRSIENRVPTARSVNTGISGFIDPLGHGYGLLRARTAGTSVDTVWLCRRVTFFTRYGPVFSELCLAVTLATAGVSMLRWILRRRRRVVVA
jgi:apolipoprotein N-acyltransferase